MLKIIFAVIALLLLFVIDFFFAVPVQKEGILLDKQYKPGRISTGTGISYSGNGTTTVTTTVEADEESWFFIVRNVKNQEIKVFSVSSRLYYQKDIIVGKNIFFKTYYGRLSGWPYYSLYGTIKN